ncbi:MAG: ACP S-malonyltransferase [Thermodesulfobacteriota bacterium]
MKNIAFLFPGQGSQFVGMAKAIYEGSSEVKAIFEEANSILGRDLKGLMFEGPNDELDLTRNAQTALLVANYACLTALTDIIDIKPAVYAGHSLGEFSALVAAGALSFADALRLVDLRGKFMQEAVKVGEGKMCAVLGLGTVDLDNICAEASTDDSIVVVANINCPGQVVISGHTSAVERASEAALKAGAKRAIILKVTVPSHSPLMEGASAKLAEVMAGIEFKEMQVPVVTNVEAALLDDYSRAPELLCRQLVSPVRWVESIELMKSNGITAMIEVGPGKVLTTLIKRIDPDIEIFKAGEPKDLEALAKVLKEEL